MKRTYQPNNLKAKKDHGFFARKEGKGNILSSRRKKGRKVLSK
jgi:ribosomal protein L34